MAYDQYGRPMGGGYGDSTTANLRHAQYAKFGWQWACTMDSIPILSDRARSTALTHGVGTQVRMYGATLAQYRRRLCCRNRGNQNSSIRHSMQNGSDEWCSSSSGRLVFLKLLRLQG